MNFTERHTWEISEFLQKIYQLQDSASLYAVICRNLSKLVEGHNIFIGTHDMKRTLITGCAVTRPFETPDFLEIVNSCVGQHPLWEPIREGRAEVRCISRFSSATRWKNTMLYREALGFEGIKDHLSIEFGERRNRLTSVGIFRDSHGFSDRDVATMSMLMPHLEQAMENARIAELAQIVGDTNEDSLVLVDRKGRVIQAPAKVAAAFSGNGGGPLAEVCRWMAGCASSLRKGALEVSLAPLRLRHADRAYEMRMYQCHDGNGFRIMVRTSGEPQIVLSMREWETLHWIRQGKTNDEIAIILGLKSTTVKTHVQHILQKLSVENRVAAARFPVHSIRRR